MGGAVPETGDRFRSEAGRGVKEVVVKVDITDANSDLIHEKRNECSTWTHFAKGSHENIVRIFLIS